MAWVDYGYYTDTFLGRDIAREDFPMLEERSERFVEYITGGEAAAERELDCVKKAVCAVAEAWQKQRRGGAIKGESVGEWSRVYSERPAYSAQRTLLEAARVYLMGSGLMRTVDWA